MEEKKRPLHQGSTVWHYYTGDGRRVRRRLQPGAQPEAHWIRGFGPHSTQVREALTERTRAWHRTHRVSEQTRERMSQAKRGVPKTLEHRVSMSIAQRERHRRRRDSESGDK